MHDQANQLRQLVSRVAATPQGHAPCYPNLLAVAGGKGGVGTTTVAVNLAVEFARSGWRAALIDADPDGGDVAVFCGLEDRYTLADVAAGRRSTVESLQEGPRGMKILPGAWADSLTELPNALFTRILDELLTVADPFQMIVVDAGSGRGDWARHLWQVAGQIVVVTTPELASVMDAYGSIKVLGPDEPATRIYTLVNMTPNAMVANNVQQRLATACLRFLETKIFPLDHLDRSPRIAGSNRDQPLMRDLAECPATQQIGRVAARLIADRPHQQTRNPPLARAG